MSETDWMYDSLTERFGETLGERQVVVDALLIAKAVVGPGTLGGTPSDSLLTVARFILDEWGKYSDAEDAGDEDSDGVVLDTPVELDNRFINEADFDLMKYGTCTFPEGSRWATSYGVPLIFTGGDFLEEGTRRSARIFPETFPFIRIKEEEN